MPNQSSPILPDYRVTEDLDAFYVRSLQGHDGQRVLRTFAEVFERENHAAQPVAKLLEDVSR